MSLSIIFFFFFEEHLCYSTYQNFILLHAEQHSTEWIYHSLFIHFLLMDTSPTFWLLWIMLLAWVPIFNSLGIYLGRNGTAGSLGTSTSCFKKLPDCFPPELCHFHILALHKAGLQVSTPSWTFGIHFQGCGSLLVILLPNYMKAYKLQYLPRWLLFC